MFTVKVIHHNKIPICSPTGLFSDGHSNMIKIQKQKNRKRHLRLAVNPVKTDCPSVSLLSGSLVHGVHVGKTWDTSKQAPHSVTPHNPVLPKHVGCSLYSRVHSSPQSCHYNQVQTYSFRDLQSKTESIIIITIIKCILTRVTMLQC